MKECLEFGLRSARPDEFAFAEAIYINAMRPLMEQLDAWDEPLRRAINAGKPSAEIKDVAIEKSGLKTLRQDGIEKALQGLTTLEEVLAVTAN